jgi:hypothetical protein
VGVLLVRFRYYKELNHVILHSANPEISDLCPRHTMLYQSYHQCHQGARPSPIHNSNALVSIYSHVDHPLSTRSDKPFVLLVRLIPIAVLLRPQLLRQLIYNRGDQFLLALLVIRVTVPDGDLNRVPADAVGETADVVVECCESR